MDFERVNLAPFFVLGIAGLGLVFWLCERRRLKLIDAVCPLDRAAQILPAWRQWAAKGRAVAFLTGLSLLAVALLKPYDGLELREISRKGVDIYLLVDLSESMRAQDIRPSRMERARREIKDFLHLLHGDRVGLIGFAGEAFVFVPLTSDYAAYALFLDELSPDAIPVQGTDIKGAISKAMESFRKLSKASGKAMILITDGEDSVGLDSSITERMRADGIKSFVMGIGTPEGAPIPLPEGGYKADASGHVVLTRLNEAVLQDLALQTGGGYVRSVSGDLDLDQIYRRGIKAAFTDEALATTQKKLPHYQFQIFLLVALGAFIVESLIGNRKRAKVSLNSESVKSLALLFLIFLARPALAINPFDLEKAGEAFEAKDYKGSAQIYRELLAKEPGDARLAFNLGDTLYQEKKYAEAAAAYKQALNAADPLVRQQALYNLGNTAFREEKLEDALGYYEKALAMDEKYQKAQLNYDFVKKKLEQKQQDEQKKDQQDESKQDQEKQQDEQKQDEQKSDEQKDEQQKNEQKKDGEGYEQKKDEGQEQDKSDGGEPKEKNEGEGKDSEQKDKKPETSEGKDKPDDQQSGEGDKPSEDQEKPSESKAEKNNGSATPENGKQNEGMGQQGQGSTQGTYDQQADQWLESIGDEPGKALKMLIERQTPARAKKMEKDW
jgi:Ca-activated chloride channel family protein